MSDAESSRAHAVPPRPGRDAPSARLAEILRVDHAGELAAVHIYRAQNAVLGGSASRARIGGQLAEMERQEAEHLNAFDAILIERRVRPSLLTPLWRVAALALGAGTALMGERAAHACTEAVENVIERHYAEQIAEISPTEPALARSLAEFRDQELSHRDLAVAEGARAAPGYRLLSAAIGTGCRVAIKISEKL
jgi:ubiquinone biosynthesis monooxygenase Coq7